MAPGQIVILNGAPRSGKSGIAAAMQESFSGIWMNIGVDAFVRHVTPPGLRPGIGLRPGGERPDLEAHLPRLYEAFYGAVGAHGRQGLNVVVDAVHHDAYTRPLNILGRLPGWLEGLPVMLVGVRCPVEVIMARRRAGQAGREGEYEAGGEGDPVPEPVLRWQRYVHEPGIYDLEVDTAAMSPDSCAEAIRQALAAGLPRPTALERLRS